MDAAHAAACVDKATRACGTRGIHQHAVLADMRIDNIYARQSSHLADSKLRCQRMRTHAAIVVTHLAADNAAQSTAVRCLKGRHVRRIRLHHITTAVNLVVHHHEYALACAFGAHRRLYRINDIQRAVRAYSRRRTHSAHQHHRLVALHRQVQEERRFLHGICAVRNHHAIDILLRQQLIAALRQTQQQSVRNAAAVDIAKLLTANLRQLAQSRHARQQIVHTVRSSRIACQLRARGSLAGNSTARCQNLYLLHHRTSYLFCSR